MCCSGAFALASSSFAATLPQRGLASAFAAGLSVENGPPVLGVTQDPILLKRPLNQTAPLTTWTVASANLPLPLNLPDYSAAALWEEQSDVADVDGHSRGVDQVPPPDSQGAPSAGSSLGNWLAYVVSVKQGSPAEGNPHLNALNAGQQAIGAELVSFYAASSVNLDSSIVGTTRIEATATSLGYSGNIATTPDLDAVDYGIGVNTYGGPNSGSQVIFQASNRYYFTLTPAGATAWNAKTGFICWVAGLPREAHPADIYVKEWTQPTATEAGFWGPVELYRSYEDLDLTEEDDVDALSVTEYRSVPTPGNTNDVIVFSTAGPNPLSQLLINRGAGTTQTLTDRDTNGAYSNVADNLGLGGENDDIDGLCPIDPKEIDLLDRAVGTPSTSLAQSPLVDAFGLAAFMDVSLERGIDPTTNLESVMIQVSEWGGLQPQNCDMLVWLYTGSQAIEANDDPLGDCLIPNGGTPNWVPFPIMFDRPASMEQWELSVPFGAPNAGGHMAVMVTVFAKPIDGGALIAGSQVVQIEI